MKTVVVDIETKDPDLEAKGPSIIRGGGKLCYVSVYDGVDAKTYGGPDGETWKHPDLLALLADPSVTKVFHNAMYDLNWFINGYDVLVHGVVRDTMIRESMLNSYAKSVKGPGHGYSLEGTCYRYNIAGKNKLGTIDKWWHDVGMKGKAIEHIDEIPPDIVAAYAEQDVRATWDLYQAQEPKMEAECLHEAEILDCDMLPLALMMYRNGTRFDSHGNTLLAVETAERLFACKERLRTEFGLEDHRRRVALECAACDAGFLDDLQKTDTGQVSFDKNSLTRVHHPLARLLMETKRLEKMLGTYLQKQFPEFCINGRIHPLFHPSLGEDGGAKTGRWSCSNPNLQNVPKDRDAGGDRIRALFIADEGRKFCKMDYSQVEYLILAHYAICIQAPGWRELQENLEAGISYHKLMQKLVGWSDDHYKLVKNFNFGTVYGMGLQTFANKHYEDCVEQATARKQTVLEYCTDMREQYFNKAPFVRPTTSWIQKQAQKQGYVRSFGGRKHRMPPPQYDPRTNEINVPVYKLVNYLIQGGASDIFKMALRDANKAGIWKYLDLNLVVHDEVDYNSDGSKGALEAEDELERILTSAIQLRVPLRVEKFRGDTWKESKE